MSHEEMSREEEMGVRVENKMGVMPIPSLLISMSLPMMISMLVMACYNVVDSIFVSRVSEDALTAVSLAFPMQNLMIAMGTGVGVGMNALLSRRLGEKKPEEANDVARHGIVLTACSYIIFLLIGVFGSRIYFLSQTDIMDIVNLGTTYMSIVCICSFGSFCQVVMEKLLQATGRTIYSMITQLTGAVINLIFDPMLIFGIGPFPKLGIAGAAIATVMGQIVAGILAVIFNMKRNPEIQISFKNFKLHMKLIGNILYIGVPSIVMVAITSICTFGMNKILLGFTSTAAAVFGVYFKLQSFIMMPVFGLNSGMVPIIAYNYGARKGDRIKETIKLSVVIAMVIMMIGLAMMQFLPEPMLRLFDASDNMISIGVVALRTISWSFLFAGYSIVSSSVFQAFGNGLLSMSVSIARQLCILLPVAWLLARTGVLSLVWLAYPIAELMAVVLCTIFLILIIGKVIREL